MVSEHKVAGSSYEVILTQFSGASGGLSPLSRPACLEGEGTIATMGKVSEVVFAVGIILTVVWTPNGEP